eukprot:6593621-Prymnesium_polylepis.1
MPRREALPNGPLKRLHTMHPGTSALLQDQWIPPPTMCPIAQSPLRVVAFTCRAAAAGRAHEV